MTKPALIILLLAAIPAFAVVNGDEVPGERFDAEYPWMVVVVKQSADDVCNGVLIAPQWVLTAAHCTGINKSVQLGNANRDSARTVTLERAQRHPGFDAETLQYDVGLLKLSEPVNLPTARLATAEQTATMLIAGSAGVVLGWGRIETVRGPSRVLREGPLTIDDVSQQGTQIGIVSRGGGPCGQDSGGPLVFRDDAGNPVVVALASATDGELCNKNGGLAVYTSVAVVREFVGQYIDRKLTD